jgi:hypothetical protein
MLIYRLPRIWAAVAAAAAAASPSYTAGQRGTLATGTRYWDFPLPAFSDAQALKQLSCTQDKLSGLRTSADLGTSGLEHLSHFMGVLSSAGVLWIANRSRMQLVS